MGVNVPPPARRLRVPKALAPPPEHVKFPWAKLRDELKRLDEGQVTAILMRTAAWEATVGIVCDLLDAARPRSTERRWYTSRELESVAVYQRVCGLRSSRAARDRLASDRGTVARAVLGFDRPRQRHFIRNRWSLDRVPSEATLSRHRARFDEAERADAYERCFDLLVDEHLSLMGDELLVCGMDGSSIQIHFTAPKLDPKTGEVVNADKVTAPEAGYMPESAGKDKSGHGFKLFTVAASNGLPLTYDITRINDAETTTALGLFRSDRWARVREHIPEGKAMLVSADGGLHAQRPSVRTTTRRFPGRQHGHRVRVPCCRRAVCAVRRRRHRADQRAVAGARLLQGAPRAEPLAVVQPARPQWPQPATSPPAGSRHPVLGRALHGRRFGG